MSSSITLLLLLIVESDFSKFNLSSDEIAKLQLDLSSLARSFVVMMLKTIDVTHSVFLGIYLCLILRHPKRVDDTLRKTLNPSVPSLSANYYLAVRA